MHPSLYPVETETKLSTLIDLLRLRSVNEPTLTAYRFLSGAESETTDITYGELDLRARAVAVLLQSRNLAEQRVLLLYPPGLDFIVAFCGCLYARAVAVPSSFPQTKRGLSRLQAIADDAQAAGVLTTRQVLSRIESLQDERASWTQGLDWLTTDSIADDAADWREPLINSDALAYLQYTSGSTATPKGVMVTHGNVLENSAYIRHGFEHGPESVSLSWLPHFHDMGLVDGIIQPLYSGFTGLLMSPTTLLQNPARWLQAISRYGVTHSGGPNFAYDLCVRRIDEAARASLDLSTWSVAYNGAEPVRHETLERFAAAFASCGFRRESFYPAYGLAEATLKVTGGRRYDGPRYCTVQASALGQHRVVQAEAGAPASRTLVGCGRAAEGTEVVIVNPESTDLCAPDEVGEVWVSGPGVAAGYWNRPEETEHTFYVRLSNDRRRFLRTADSGFVFDGELYIVGRLKDLIIIRGRNHYPQDIESVMQQAHASLKLRGGAAFSVEINNEERLVVVQEIETRFKPEAVGIMEAIRAIIAEEFEIQPAAVVLIKSGTLPRTSSGKVRRAACREDFLADKLRVIAEWRAVENQKRDVPPRPVELNADSVGQWLSQLLSAKLNIDTPVDVNQPITRYGIDSLLALELTHDVEIGLGVKLSLTSFLRNWTIADLTNETLIQVFNCSGGTLWPPDAPIHAKRAPVSNVPSGAGEYPLPHGQQALWTVQHLSPESTAYNVSVAARIHGEVDTAAMRRAFAGLVQRHPMLRARFPSRQGSPVCVVQEHAEISFRVEDAAGWSEETLRGRLNEDAWTTFDLENGPLLRVTFFERSAQDYVLLLSAHHLIVDFWSLAVLIRELGEFYSTGSRQPFGDQAENRAATPGPYSDYVRSQEEMLLGPEGERLRNYWLQKLAGELPALDLPTDHPRPSVQTYRGAAVSTRLDQELTERLKLLAASHETTLFMTLLAAFQVLLYRYTGQEDILVGSPSSGRGSAEFSGTVGYFVNPLVLRGHIAGNRSFSHFLGETRRTALEVFEHQDYPFDLLVKELQPERDAGRSPLFQVMFAFQKTRLHEDEALSAFALGESGVKLKLGNLSLETLALDQRSAQFDLSLTMAEVDHELAASFEYNTDLFDAATVERLSDHFRILLRGVVEDPRVSVSQIPILSSAERRQVLYDWNDTHAEFGSLAGVHESFAQQAARTPDQTAVSSDHETWTYRELNERANRLGHYLRSHGVGPDVPVAICLPRSAAMLACVFGVLKASGAYVPLDPSFPREHLAFMLEDSGALFVLTEQKFAERFATSGARLILLDVDGPAIDAGSDADLLPIATSENLAYVTYTSGSTGKPKGVMVQHGALANYIRAASLAFEIGSQDRVLQFLPFSFDGSAEEIFACLTSGATLVLRDGEVPKDPVAFMEECVEKKLTVLDLPTTYWNELVAHLSSDDWATADDLRLVIIGGDKALPQRVEQWWANVGPRIHLVNTYGPTEATIVSTMCDLTTPVTVVPIGRPVANSQAYVLDQRLQPLPVGARGELYLGGAGISRGYLGDPGLTAEKFVPDPFNSTPGARLYRTGDAVRHGRDGQIEFLGRMDQQLKIRGHRVEPAEVEAALLRHEAVRDVVVIAREEPERRLVAYVVVENVVVEKNSETTLQDLRKFLAERLPKHMMPAIFTLLESLPRLPNGKIDRRALPMPEVESSGLNDAYVAPQTSTERVLCDLWAEVLKLERVGLRDNFFELGGDSILGIQVAARARLAGLQMTPSQIFQYPTPGELAAVVSAASATYDEQELVTGDVAFTPIQHWFFEQNFSVPDHWNMALMLEPHERLDPDVLEQTFAHLLNHHDALRLRFVHEPEEPRLVRGGRGRPRSDSRGANGGEGWRQFIAEPDQDGNQANVRVVELSNLDENEQASALETIAEETQAQLNLATSVLLRVSLLEFGPGRAQRLLIVIHHLAVDGVSWRILLEDLGRVYQQLQRDETVSFPPKTTSFARWAKLLEEYARSEQTRGELDYWTSLSAKQVKPLPVDLRDGRNIEAETRTLTIVLDAVETQALLRDVARTYQVRINDVLLTALLEAFSDWTGEQTLLIELEGHGREDLFAGVDLSRTVGWFTTAFPVLLEAKSGLKPRAALQSIKQQLEGIPRNGVGYGLLRYLNTDEDAAGQMRLLPQPEVSFNYLGQLDQMLDDSLFSPARESCGRTRHGSAHRSQLLEINSFVIGGQLKCEWVYSTGFHQHQTIEGLAQRFVAALRKIISDAGERHTASLARGDVEDVYPLSPLQQGILFHTAYNPGSTIYTGQLSFTLEGDLDVEAFTRAWHRAVERHAILRSSFIWENIEEPLQAVNRIVDLSVERHDWRELPEVGHEHRLNALLEEDRRRGFDLTVAPLMRLKLLRLSDESYRFIWTHQHLLLDGWSIALLLKEIFEDYESLSEGHDERQPARREYREYIDWLRQQDTARAKSFWSSYLNGFSAPTPFVVDHAPVDASREADTRRARVCYSKDKSDGLRVFARRYQLTLNTLVQGAWALLLSRYSRETDVLYGATVAGRPASFTDVGQMVGLFINTLPVRVRVRPEMSVNVWLKSIQAEQAVSREYENSPLVELQKLSAVPNGTPLFESLLVFENYPLDAGTFGGGSLHLRSREAVGSGTGRSVEASDVWWFDQTNYPLTLTVKPEDELSLEIFYDGHRFTDDVVQRMLGHLQTILNSFTSDSVQTVAEIPLVTASERSVLLSEWNDTRKDSSGEAVCVHQLFERQVRETPDQIAIISGTEQVTYAELNVRANRLAHYLLRNGVETESRVCICFEPGVEMIVAMLGVLKAGAAYVPLDPAYPESRLAFMLGDCGARVLLTERSLLDDRLNGGLAQDTVRTVCLDTERAEIMRESQVNPEVSLSGDNLIYVIYTSGSTGRPKGAGVTHAGFVNLIKWYASEFGLTEREQILVTSSFSFDLTQKNLFTPLTVGARLHFPRSSFYDPSDVVETISENGITLLNCTPSAFNPLIDVAGPGFKKLASLKHVFLGGEPINLARFREWTSTAHFNAEIVNTYGPTECTDVCSSFRVIDCRGGTLWPPDAFTLGAERAATECRPYNGATSAPPIGRPNDNAELFILDEYLNLVPLGVAGELCVGGVGVGRGYLNDSSSTAERFVPHPYSSVPGARLYRTGDLARHLSDGNIEFLGRFDHQVKVGGYRIELGEVEAAVVQHQDVKDCVVVVRSDAHGHARLVAYVVPEQSAQPCDATMLRRYLADSLPAHMIPSVFVSLEQLPLTASGKVDRRALPPPDMTANVTSTDYVAPRTPLEEVIAGIWRDVLAVERVGIHDNFLELGGHSLLAMRCVSAMRQLFRMEIPLRVMFESANLEELAQALKVYEDQPGKLEKIARVLQKVKGVSPEELQKQLRQKRAGQSRQARASKEDA
jgi:amino acid adenylation domain-containing protein/non-ribosomal peptide synthase protein (TIGR01720 family)